MRVHPFRIAQFANIERRIDEDFDEVGWSDHLAHGVARDTIRTHGSTDDGAAVTDDLRGNEADAEDVGVTILLAESESLGEMRANDVAVEQRDLTAVLEQTADDDFCRRRLAGTAEARKPDAEALAMFWRVTLREDRRDLGTREPFRQRTSCAEKIVADLRAGDRARLRAGRNA